VDLLKLLIPIFFITFSLGEVAKIQFPGSISIGLFDIAVVLLSLFYLKKIWKRGFLLKLPIFLFIVTTIFSIAINFRSYEINQNLIGSLYILRWISYTGIYFSVVNLSPKGKKYTLNFMMFSGIFVVILGYLQLIFYPSLKNFTYLGWDEHMHRIFSSFLDPNFAGVIFVLFFVFFYIFRDHLLSNKKLLQFLILGLTFGAIILTYSRGALIMFVICALIYSIIKRNWKVILAVIGVLLIIFVILSPGFHTENTNLLRTFSSKERIKTMEQGISIFQKNPLGIGFNMLRYTRKKMFPSDKRLSMSRSGAGVDNSLILILVTTGIPGFIAYVFLLYKMFKLGFLKMAKNDMGIVLIISLGGLLINSFFINSLLYSFAMAWIFLIAGLTENNSRA